MVYSGAEPKRLFTFPPQPATGGITVTNEDLFCLNDSEFLNDVIIDFYLKYLFLEVLTPEQREKTHIFSSFFYRRLTQKHGRQLEDSKQSIQQRRHARVRTWTRHVDLFSKDYIIVPINESAHWYLAILCFPGLEEAEYPSPEAKKPKPAETPADTPSSQAETPSTSGQQIKEEEKVKDKPEDKQPTTEEDKKPTAPASSSSGPANTAAAAADKMDWEDSDEEDGPPCKQPCILMFDSLAGPSRKGVVKILRDYLQTEWDTKKQEKAGPRTFTQITYPGNNMVVPQQLNFSDCGIYLLQYTESFFTDAPPFIAVPMPTMEDWFSEDVALGKREYLQKLILQLKERHNPDLDYDPMTDGCLIESSFHSPRTFIAHQPFTNQALPQAPVVSQPPVAAQPVSQPASQPQADAQPRPPAVQGAVMQPVVNAMPVVVNNYMMWNPVQVATAAPGQNTLVLARPATTPALTRQQSGSS